MTVTELMNRIKSHIEENATAPTAGSDEWNLYLSYLNQALRDWEDTYDWSHLYREFNGFNSGTTIAMPSDFRKMAGYFKAVQDGAVYNYERIRPELRYKYSEDAKYCYLVGDNANGFNLIINGATLSSTTSIYYSYYRNAGTLASASDETMVPNPQYLVEKALTYYWRAEDDNRFQVAEQNSQLILRKMLETENSKELTYDDRIQTTNETKYSFRIGLN
jgi:hypothetical protein